MTDKGPLKLGKVIALGIADVEVIAHVEERLAGFNSFPT